MATPSSITALCSDGKYRCIYVHFDGRPENNTFSVAGNLLHHYSDQAKIDALMQLGMLSQLGSEPVGVSFGCMSDGRTCVKFDRPEDLEVEFSLPSEGATAEEAFRNRPLSGSQYQYYWDGKTWTVANSGTKTYDVQSVLNGIIDLDNED